MFQEEKKIDCLLKDGDVETNFKVGKYSTSEMLLQLKSLALNNSQKGVSRKSIGPLWDQTLRIRKLMSLSDTKFPQRKRKLQQFLKDNLKSPTGFASSKASKQQYIKNLTRGKISRASSTSSLLNVSDSNQSLHRKHSFDSHSSGSLFDDSDSHLLSSKYPDSDNSEYCCSPNKDTSQLIDSDESVNGPSPVTSERRTLQDLCPEDSNLENFPSPRRSNSLLKLIGDHFQRLVIPIGPDVQTDIPKWRGDRLRRMAILTEPRLEADIPEWCGDHLRRMVIPIGPRFQADIPKSCGSPESFYGNRNDNDMDSSRWQGMRVWPIEGQNVISNATAVGKGRPNSCSCMSPGSSDCVYRHIREKRLSLQSELGPAFSTWKFDEMGEEVSKSWTLKEQEIFELLATTNLRTSGMKFLEHALKGFPSKSKKDILSYYFNVFIPRVMSLQNRFPIETS